jgi:DNA helicase-4
MPIFQESIKSFVRTYLDFSYSLFFIKSKIALKKHKKLFDSGVVKNPLTYRQRISVILDEKRNMVVAGAGTGKTTTILAKVLYLINDKKCKADEILLLAFSKAAETELKNRLLAKSISDVKIKTMHALGLEVIKRVQGSIPNVASGFNNRNDKLKVFIAKIIDDLREDDPLNESLASYFSEYLIPYKPETDFKNAEEYLSWRSMNSLLTFNNDWVKSHGELLIGNFLYGNSIPHSYESKYKYDDDYRPDFYIEGTDIYIEYFGIDKNKNTAPWINKEKYNEGIVWKKNLHKQSGTKLIEITFEDFKDGTWKKKLTSDLIKYKVAIQPISPKEILNRARVIADGKIFNKLSQIISQFLTLFKSKSMSIERLTKEYQDNERILTFLKIFKVVYDAYEAKLKEDDSIDYMDMLNEATRYIKEGKYKSEWKYIIIDEFQDTSFAQYEFVNNLLAQRDDTKMYCVGDDWQSIFAFSGADYHYMTDYKEYFGVANFWSKFTGKKQEATLITLNETFRFNNMISHTSGTFIQKNPAQIKKDLKVADGKMTDQKSVFVHWGNTNNEENIRDWLDQYSDKKEFRKKNLLILSRYNYDFKNFTSGFNEYIKERWRKNGSVILSTCHASKGTEDDVVLIVNVSSSFLGFPSNVVDDTLLDLVKTSKENEYLHAEERRLFYVAMTRAKYQTHILCDTVSPSVFAQEIEQENYKTEVIRNAKELVKCPECKKGYVINKTKNPNKEPFYQCSRADICSYVGVTCSCGGQIYRVLQGDKSNKEIAVCTNKKCTVNHEFCKECALGIMKERRSNKGSFDPFMSCHRYPLCKYSKDI